MSSSEQLERETEEERARISETLDELRARMTPGHVLDRLVDYATDSSGGMFFRNLRKQLVGNPVPVALVGTGIAWLAISGRRGASSTEASAGGLLSRTTEKISAVGDELAEGVKHAADTASDTASKLSDRAASAADELGQQGQATASNLQDAARETAGVVTDKASSGYDAASSLAGDATSRVRDAAHSAIDAVGETASSAYDAAADRARRTGDKLQKSASSVRVKAAASGRSIMDFVSEQPLVVVGLGLAIGAAIGAASPSTETEDRLMGESSDAMKKEAADLAKEQAAKVQGVAERAGQDATAEAENTDSVLPFREGDSTLGSRPEAATSDTPLAPTTEAPASREDERSEH
jgi:ElaB/YqjD/DUF883 family membrane-anchored ribosome-binding protein